MQKLTTNAIAYWAKELPGMGGVYSSYNLNLYAYSRQNPVKYIDPDGEAVFTAAIGAWVGKSALEGLGDVALDKTIAHLSGEEYGSWDAVKSFGSGFGLGLIGAGIASKGKKILTILKLTKLRSLRQIEPGKASSLYNNKFAKRIPGGSAKKYEKVGGFKQANKEFDKLTKGLKVKINTKDNVRSAILKDGTTVDVRPHSSQDLPTIDIIPKKGKRIKI